MGAGSREQHSSKTTGLEISGVPRCGQVTGHGDRITWLTRGTVSVGEDGGHSYNAWQRDWCEPASLAGRQVRQGGRGSPRPSAPHGGQACTAFRMTEHSWCEITGPDAGTLRTPCALKKTVNSFIRPDRSSYL